MASKTPVEEQLKQVLGQDEVKTFPIPGSLGSINVRFSNRHPDTIKEIVVAIGDTKFHISKTLDDLHVANLKNSSKEGLADMKKPGDRLEKVVVYATGKDGKAFIPNDADREKVQLILKGIPIALAVITDNPFSKHSALEKKVLDGWMKDIKGTDGKPGMVETALNHLQSNTLLQPVSPAKASASPRQ